MFKVNRLEVIDHTSTGKGRDYVKWEDSNFAVTLQLQDGNRTLKMFLYDDIADEITKQRRQYREWTPKEYQGESDE